MVPVERSHERVTMLTITLKAAIVGRTRSGDHPWLMKKMTAMAPLIPETPERMPLKKPATMLRGNSRMVGVRNPLAMVRVTATTIEPTMIFMAAGFTPARMAVPMGIPQIAAANIWRVTFVAMVFRSRKAMTAARMIPRTRATDAASFGGNSCTKKGAATMMKPNPVREFMNPENVTTRATKKIVIGHSRALI